jgi:putative phosphoesterase
MATDLRIALFSDVHGNLIALDAVLDDIRQSGGVDEYWVVGDLAALGPQPVAVLDRLDSIGAIATRGNTDRYLFTGQRPPPSIEDARANPTLISIAVEASGNFAWTQGCLDQAGAISKLEELPLDRRIVLADGTRLLAVHARPDNDDGPGLDSRTSDEELMRATSDAAADMIIVGHTHRAFDGTVDSVRVINLGSVSLPATSDRRACWVLLESNSSGHSVEHRRVPYDLAAVVQTIRGTHNPASDWLAAAFEPEGCQVDV